MQEFPSEYIFTSDKWKSFFLEIENYSTIFPSIGVIESRVYGIKSKSVFMSFTRYFLCVVTIILNNIIFGVFLSLLQKVIGINSFFLYTRNRFTSTP